MRSRPSIYNGFTMNTLNAYLLALGKEVVYSRSNNNQSRKL